MVGYYSVCVRWLACGKGDSGLGLAIAADVCGIGLFELPGSRLGLCMWPWSWDSAAVGWLKTEFRCLFTCGGTCLGLRALSLERLWPDYVPASREKLSDAPRPRGIRARWWRQCQCMLWTRDVAQRHAITQRYTACHLVQTALALPEFINVGTCNQCWVIGPDLIEQVLFCMSNFRRYYPNNTYCTC